MTLGWELSCSSGIPKLFLDLFLGVSLAVTLWVSLAVILWVSLAVTLWVSLAVTLWVSLAVTLWVSLAVTLGSFLDRGTHPTSRPLPVGLNVSPGSRVKA
ncbi:hypothetical protein GCM10009526_23570 [Glutamicibacter creatinolyticus]